MLPCLTRTKSTQGAAAGWDGALAAVGALTALPLVAAPEANGALAPPDRSGGMTVEQALARRRAVRRYAHSRWRWPPCRSCCGRRKE